MATTQVGALHSIFSWVESQGEVKAVDRLKVLCLSVLMDARIFDLDEVTPETTVSDHCLTQVRDAATRVVGTRCPF